jgi:hypothetical protein
MGDRACEGGAAINHTYTLWRAEGDEGEGFSLREVGIDESDGGGTAIDHGISFNRVSIVRVVCDSTSNNQVVLIKIQSRYLKGLLLFPPAATITGVYAFSASTVAW